MIWSRCVDDTRTKMICSVMSILYVHILSLLFDGNGKYTIFPIEDRNWILGKANLFTSLFSQTQAKYKKEARQI